MLCNNFLIGLQATLQPQKTASGGLKMTSEAAGTRPNHFQHQKLPLYAQSREPFHTGHGWPFRTNTQTNSSLFY